MNSELRISQVDTQLESYELTRARVETEMDRLRSRSFAERVAGKLDLFKDTSYLPVGENGPKLGSPERKRAVVDKLLQSYEPQRSGESLVIYIEAHANTPDLAARIANGVVSLVRLRNTPVPGTRCTGGVRSWSASIWPAMKSRCAAR